MSFDPVEFGITIFIMVVCAGFFLLWATEMDGLTLFVQAVLGALLGVIGYLGDLLAKGYSFHTQVALLGLAVLLSWLVAVIFRWGSDRPPDTAHTGQRSADIPPKPKFR